MNQSSWICLKTEMKREHIAGAHLTGAGAVEDVFCPRVRFPKATRRGRVHFVEALFPGYIFAKFALDQAARQVALTRAVSGIVRFGNHVPTLPEPFIQDLRDRCGGQGEAILHVNPDLRPGDNVVVADGALAGSSAIVLANLPGSDRVRILLDFLGRTLEMETTTTSLVLNAAIRALVA
jgi:transcriptional antiterminator RfaH